MDTSVSQVDTSVSQADTSISQADTSISQADTSISQATQHIAKELIGTSIELDWEKVDGSVEQYGSASAWKKAWSGFPDDFYPVLEAFSNTPLSVNECNETPKQKRNRLKKEQKMYRGKKLRK